jgi:RNA polymerase sigma-70 factor (ECF subfamily)
MTGEIDSVAALVARAPESMGGELADRIRAASDRWPGVDLPEEAFVDYLAGRLPKADAPRKAWESWAVEELYLCCACVRGDASAVELFERQNIQIVRAAIRRLRPGRPLEEELVQQLREELHVGRGGPPLLSSYAGLGRLSGWLNVVVTRIARRQMAREERYVPVGDDQLAQRLLAQPEVDDPASRRHLAVFRHALRTALGELETRDLNLLRLRYKDGLTLQHIGSIYRVHNATVFRWIDRIHERLLERTKGLMEEQGIAADECASVMRTLQGQLDLTITTLLRSPEEGVA